MSANVNMPKGWEGEVFANLVQTKIGNGRIQKESGVVFRDIITTFPKITHNGADN